MRTLGRMRGRPCTQPFLVEAEKGGFRLSPQRNASPAPLGNPVAPSSVTSGDSFPQGEASGLCGPTRKKRPKSGHVHGFRNSPSTGTLRPTTPKPASENERAMKRGSRGNAPASLRLSPEKGPARSRAETTLQGPPCAGPNGTTCRQQDARAAPGSLQTKREGPKAFPFSHPVLCFGYRLSHAAAGGVAGAGLKAQLFVEGLLPLGRPPGRT